MSQLRVLIVGASIAGPMTAYWLAKAGANITIIERFPELRTSGQNVDIRNTGVTVMQKIPGMEEAVRAKLYHIEGLSFVSEDGRSYGTIKATGNPEQQSLVSEFEIFRGDLSRIIFDLTKDNENVKYVFGEQVVSIQQNEKSQGSVRVEFANGFPTAEYDLVVACDGATSRTRAIGFGCGVRDHIISTNAWLGYFSSSQDFLNGGRIGQGYSAPGGRSITLGPGSSGVNRVGLFGMNSYDNMDAAEQFRMALKQGDGFLKSFMAQHYQGMGWKSEAILRDMMESKDFYASEVVQVKPPTLSRGHFVLVGDAGYAPGFTGTGTSLAMTGSYVLAGEILKHKGDLVAGLQAYEERMRPIIKDLQKMPPFVATIMAPQTAWGIWLRNNIFALVVWTGILEFAQRLFGGSAAAKDTYALPDYEWVS